MASRKRPNLNDLKGNKVERQEIEGSEFKADWAD